MWGLQTRMKKTKGKTRKKAQAPVRLRVMAEYGSSGIWYVQQIGVFRHDMIAHSALCLPKELAERFTRWIALYEDSYDAPQKYDVLAFNTEGRLLAQALKNHVGDLHSVEFQAETSEGGLCPSEEIL